ncbi:hypothetical protein [Rhodopila sp.]|uniref:hypothetical protein n=1 Tax=Rhodopila sp. TaxID=2480087 RepID=UPI003D0E5D5F
MSDAPIDDIDRPKMRQIIADIDQKRADTDRKRQEIQFAPWQILMTGLGSGAALFAAGAAFMKVFG